MARTLTAEIPARKLAQLCLHERYQPVQGGTNKVSYVPQLMLTFRP